MFAGYLNNQEKYGEKFRSGLYHTGDSAYRDRDGYFWFCGRDDDVINTAGHLIGPFEVESILMEVPEIADVAVVGARDEVLYEKVVAFVVLRHGCSWTPELELRIRTHATRRLSSLGSPREIVVLEAIPKSKSGKVMRRVLRSRYEGTEIGDLSTLED